MSSTRADHIRYLSSLGPEVSDGRDIDARLGTLSGEAAHQRVGDRDKHPAQFALQPWEANPPATRSGATYYDRPMLKQSVWSLDIPLYYFVGGAAGAALTLGAAIQFVSPPRHREFRRLSAICHWIGIVGSTTGAVFLIHDLGRPERFLYMLRVFRPTSPMNVGAWILSGAAPTAIATGLFLNSPGVLGAVGEICGYISGLFGAALATYTGVLVSNTAIPLWQESRRWMPVLFAASGATTVGSILDIAYTGKQGRNVGWLFGNVGRLAEIGAAHQAEKAASRVRQVGEPLHRGNTAVLWKTATALTVASLTLSLISSKSRQRRIAAGVLGVAGSLCMRFAVHYAANASARDPRATIENQRAR